MPDLLIRNIPQSDVERLDARAARLGLTRADFLRRRLHEEAVRADEEVTVDDFTRLGAIVHDLTDDDVMREAWS